MKSLLPLIVFACACLPAMAQEQRLVHQDVKRKFIVYTPASYAANPQQQFPVVINYHGGVDTSPRLQRLSPRPATSI